MSWETWMRDNWVGIGGAAIGAAALYLGWRMYQNNQAAANAAAAANADYTNGMVAGGPYDATGAFLSMMNANNAATIGAGSTPAAPATDPIAALLTQLLNTPPTPLPAPIPITAPPLSITIPALPTLPMPTLPSAVPTIAPATSPSSAPTSTPTPGNNQRTLVQVGTPNNGPTPNTQIALGNGLTPSQPAGGNVFGAATPVQTGLPSNTSPIPENNVFGGGG